MEVNTPQGLIFDIRRFSVHDGPGIRTTVFFKGCPLKCWWCHNPESRYFGEETTKKVTELDGQAYSCNEITGKWMNPADVLREIIRDRVFFEESGGGVTFSGGEPLMQPSFLLSILAECKQSGIHTTIDTSGYVEPAVLKEVASLANLFLYDLKLAGEAEHTAYTGVSNNVIIENLKYLLSVHKPVIIRIPVIPGITGTAENISGLKQIILNLKTGTIQGISLLPYHTLGTRKYPRFNMENRLPRLKNMPPQELIPLTIEFETLGIPVTIGN